MFTGVQHTEIDAVWPEISYWVEAACRHGGLLRAQDIADGLKAQTYQLWVYRSDTTRLIEAICVTEVRQFALAKVCDLIIGTGRDRNNWQDNIYHIEQWAKAIGCVRMRPIVRYGWLKQFRLFGYRPTHIAMEKEL